ncbi:hypothetical protein BX600DRAFT_517987 [Xylariales sp. PMI_506]|nr:hypothetical protein BX600DRAFT_517987 [Xylariales sp. PMI_506]
MGVNTIQYRTELLLGTSQKSLEQPWYHLTRTVPVTASEDILAPLALMMQDYLIRHGYFPVIFQGFEPQDYLHMIKDAQDEKPEDFVDTVLLTQLEEMRTFKMRET